MFDPLEIGAIRSAAWRLGRRLYCWARRDVRNDPATNGEYWLLEKLISQSGNNVTLLDIGANRGDWTQQSCAMLERHRKNGRVHAFEPTQSTFELLSDRFQVNGDVCLHKIAFSEQSGMAEFFVVGKCAGTNSLQKTEAAAIEEVRTQRFDDFIAASGLEEILLVKCDTEGHDMTVLRGAEKSLLAARVQVWQFEYNHRWIGNHSSLKDVFDFIDGKSYRLGKLYGRGIELYEQWHPELERYFESNYVLVREGSAISRHCTRMRFDVSNVAVMS